MLYSEERKKIQELAKKIQATDKRLSWETCVKKAKESQRRFSPNNF